MRSNFSKRILFPLLLVAVSCSTTRHLPPESYLLNDVKLKVLGTKISSDRLENLVRQKPNSNFLFVPKLSLRIYSLSGKDSSKVMNRLIRKMGAPPVVFDSLLMEQSVAQMKNELVNQGYLRGDIIAIPLKHDKKVDLTYYIMPGKQYKVNKFSIAIADSVLPKFIGGSSDSFLINIAPGTPFEPHQFDAKLKEMVVKLRNQGFYYLSNNHFYFSVDTMVGNGLVDIELSYRNIPQKRGDLSSDFSLTRCYINRVICYNGYDYFDTLSRNKILVPDTMKYNEIEVVKFDKNLIRPSMVYHHNFIRPGNLYSDASMDKTYTSLNSIEAVDRVNIRLLSTPGDSSLLDAYIILSPANIFYTQLGVDGTHTAGDLGISAHVSFLHKNLFGGAETLKLKIKGAFEHIKANELYSVAEDNYYEYGGELSLSIPRLLLPGFPEQFRQQAGVSTLFSFSMDCRNRPEYYRRFLTWDWKYSWTSESRRFAQVITLYNLNFVVSPWSSTWFESYLNQPENIVLKESYKDLFITRSSYAFLYRKSYTSTVLSSYSFQGLLEAAGTLPALIFKAAKIPKREGEYQIFGTPFVQYLKATLSGVLSLSVARKNLLVFHGAFGFSIPYGNSVVIPYEQRFFAGGASSVRGWSTRELGPGSYKSNKPEEFLNRTGDIKLVLNAEYRIRTRSVIEFALFLDAGNIWTIKHYPNQPGGSFRWNQFYKEIALSCGVGVRPNFKFVVLRLDAGIKLYDPADAGRWSLSQFYFWKDFAFHFAVGYPF